MPQSARKIADFPDVRAAFPVEAGVAILGLNKATRQTEPVTVDLSGYATMEDVNASIAASVAALVDSSPAVLDTLNELAAALGDDANFATTVTNSIATKITQTQGDVRYLQLTGGTLSGGLLGTTIGLSGNITANGIVFSDTGFIWSSAGNGQWASPNSYYSLTGAAVITSSFNSFNAPYSLFFGRQIIQHLGSATNDTSQDALRIQPSAAALANRRALGIYTTSGDAAPISGFTGDGKLWVNRTDGLMFSEIAGFYGGFTRLQPAGNTEQTDDFVFVATDSAVSHSLILAINSVRAKLYTNTAKEIAFGTSNSLTQLRLLADGNVSMSGTLSAAGATLSGNLSTSSGALSLVSNTNIGGTSGYAGLVDGTWAQKVVFSANSSIMLGNLSSKFYTQQGGLNLVFETYFSGLYSYIQHLFQHLGSATNDSTQAAQLIKPSAAPSANYQAIRIEPYNSTTPVFSVDGSGRTGIGTSLFPINQYLAIKSPATTNAHIATIFNGNGEGLSIYHTGTDGYAPHGGANVVVINSTFESTAYRPLALATGGNARLFIKTSGEVGIGTTTPSSTLDVNGTISAAGATINATALQSAYFTSNHGSANRVGINHSYNTGFGLFVGGGIKWSIASTDYSGIGGNTGTQPDFVLYNDQIAATAIYVDGATNKTGIGTINPQATLDVNGSLFVGSQTRFSHLGSATNDTTQDALRIQPSGSVLANYRPLAIYLTSGAAIPDTYITSSGKLRLPGGGAGSSLTVGMNNEQTGMALQTVGGIVFYSNGAYALGIQNNAFGDGRNAVHVPDNTRLGWETDSYFVRNSANVIKAVGKLTSTLGIGVGNSAAATTPGTVTNKMEVFDASGVSLGYVAIYDAIT
jgi:hypothetical protein